MTNTATRLITLIMLLENRPNQKASELAERLGVSVRTLHRYIGMLDELGIPIYSERGPQGGFSLVRGYKMPPLIFTPSEAVALCLGTGLVADLWGQLYSEPAQSALAKLENILPDEQTNEVKWARGSLVNTPLPNPRLQSHAPRLTDLRHALRERKRVRLVYQANNQPDLVERDFDAYALAYRTGWWYIMGYCHLRQDVRSFRVDRIQQLEILTTSYEIPADFDAQTYLAFEVQAEKGILLKMHLTAEMAYLATATPAFWESLEMQSDGSVIVTTRMIDIYRGAGFVFSYGPAATVLEPKELQDLMRTWSTKLASQYSSLSST